MAAAVVPKQFCLKKTTVARGFFYCQLEHEASGTGAFSKLSA